MTRTSVIWQKESPTPCFSPRSPLRAIQARGAVRVAVLDDLPGFAWRDSATGLRSGLDIEISKFMAQGIFGGTLEYATNHIEFIDVTAPQRELACREGWADFVVSAFTDTDARRKRIDFTKPYHGTSLAMIVRSDQQEFDSSTATIAVVEGSTCHAYVREQGIGRDILTFEYTSEVPAAVVSGEASAGMIMSALVDKYVRLHQLPIKQVKHSLAFDPWAIGVRKGEDALRAFLDKCLQQVIHASAAPTA